jgi:undecaprenyl-diphosphatase
VALVCFVLFVLLAGAVLAGWTTRLDSAILRTVGTWRTPALTGVMRTISLLGKGEVEVPLALLLSLRLSLIRRRQEAAGYAAAALSGWALYGVAKWTFARPRPRLIPRLSDAGWYSFPSGHAMLAPLVFGLGALIWSAPWPRPARVALLILAGAVSLLVAASRVYLGVHWPTDVIAGLLLGTSWAGLWVWWWERAAAIGEGEAVAAVATAGGSRADR